MLRYLLQLIKSLIQSKYFRQKQSAISRFGWGILLIIILPQCISKILIHSIYRI
jgi:hypothetical protein